MTLFDLTRGLFAYLVRFREIAATIRAPSLAELRGDLLRIFARMDAQTKSNMFLRGPYERVRYALVVLADEVVLTSGWEHGPAWQGVLLERSYFGTAEGGARFFELARDLERAPQDVAAVFYLCLALGFCGCYAPSDERLREIKAELLALLPETPALVQTEDSPAQAPRPAPTAAAGKRPLIWTLAGGLVLIGAVWFWGPWMAGTDQASTLGPAPPATAAPPVTQPPPEPAPPPTAPPITQPAPPVTQPQPETAPPESAPPPPTAPPVTQPAPPAAARAQAPPAPEASEPAEAAEAETPAYFIQVGVFKGPIQSARLAERLQGADLPARAVEPRGRSSWYKVLVGPLESREEAEKARAAIKAQFGITGIIKTPE